MNGDPHPVEPIVTALRAEVDPPEPERRVARYDPKMERIIGGGAVIEENRWVVPVYADELEPAQPAGGRQLLVDGVPVFMGDPAAAGGG